MGFHEVRFPTNISYGSRGGPGFSTNVIRTDSGAEERVARYEVPLHEYDAGYGIRTYDDLVTVKDFYIHRLGPAFGFRWKDHLDFTSAAKGRDAHDDEDQEIGIGDGTETTFQLVKKYSDALVTRTRNIEKPVAGTVLVAIDGAAQTEGVDFTVNTTNGVVTFTTAPLLNEVITAGFEFDVPVRFGIEIDALLAISFDDFGSGSTAIPVSEIRDPRQASDEFFFGGAKNHGLISADITITLLDGRVQQVEPNTTGLAIILPDADDIPAGAPIFILRNEGTQSIDVETPDTTTVGTIPVSGTAELFISEDSVGAKTWFII